MLLESAYFDPGSIRRTSRTLGLRTDAAYRFERGADIEGLLDANDRAAQLMAELAGGTVARGMLDAYPRRRKPVRVRLRMERVERVLGVAPRRAHARRILTGLGLAVRERGAILDVEVPSFRRDLAMEDDLAEEIIRVWGYDKIPSTLPGGQTVEVARESDRLRQEGLLRRALAGVGLMEAVASSFTDRARSGALGVAEPLALLNPLSQDAAYLRAHPLDGILGVVAVNTRRQEGDVRVFEIGKTYQSSTGGDTGTSEPRWLALAVSGARGELSWRDGGGAVDVYDAKGLAEHALAALGVATSTRTGGALGGFEPDCHASLRHRRRRGRRRVRRGGGLHARGARHRRPRLRRGRSPRSAAARAHLRALPGAAALPLGGARHGLPGAGSRAERGGRGDRRSGARPGRCCARSSCSTSFACPTGSVVWPGG